MVCYPQVGFIFQCPTWWQHITRHTAPFGFYISCRILANLVMQAAQIVELQICKERKVYL